jgi:hypothetical protein
MSAKRWRRKSVFETILCSIRIGIANGAHTRLTSSFIYNVDAVTSTVATWNVLGLPIKTDARHLILAELTHGILSTKCAGAYSHRDCTLNTPMNTTVRSKPSSLVG